MAHQEFFYAPPVASEKEMAAFAKICQVAKHGVKYKENWNALGYSYPNKSLLSFIFKSDKNSKMTINDLLKDFLLDNIVCAGLEVIGLQPGKVLTYLSVNRKELNDEDLSKGLCRRFHYGEKKIGGLTSIFSLENRLNEEGLSTRDAKRLESVLEMIKASYTEVFTDIFKDY